MAQVSVEKRQFTNDQGSVVNYNVVCIQGVLNGKVETWEKSIGRTDAMLVGMLLDSDENVPVVESRKANEDEGERVNVTRKPNSGLDFLDD